LQPLTSNDKVSPFLFVYGQFFSYPSGTGDRVANLDLYLALMAVSREIALMAIACEKALLAVSLEIAHMAISHEVL
jgi:hypothetical protein